MSQFVEPNNDQDVMCWRCGTWVSKANFTSHSVECFETRRSKTARPAPTQTPKRKKSKKLELVPEYIKEQQKQAQAKAPSGGRAIKCPKCAEHIAESKYEQHRQACQGHGQAPSQASQGPDQAPSQAKPKQRKQQSDEPKQRKTADGYPIERCHYCGKRICLFETRAATYECYDISYERKRSTRHMCDGDRSVRRFSKLIYTGKHMQRK
jgi:hypothetical protein